MINSLVLGPDKSAVSEARRFVRGCCDSAGVTGDCSDTAVLLTSETVTNAFVHGRSEARLAVTIGADGILIEVGDDNSRRPEVGEHDVDALNGRGLLIMSLLADHWGVRDERVGKTVWFQIRVA